MRPMGRPLGSRNLHGELRSITEREVLLYMKRVGELVRDARLYHDASVHELARCSGVDYTTIHRIEGGYTFRADRHSYRGPAISILIRIARALDITPHELMP